MSVSTKPELSSLEQIFFAQSHNVCQKWMHYFDIYEQYFSRFREKRVRFLEIGVSQGGSLDMWKRYLGHKASIIGVDINPASERFADSQVEIFIGDQGDEAFLDHLASAVKSVDVILDDGGHMMDQQIKTFEKLFPILSDNGVYMCEDVHTSYGQSHGGGLRKSGTYIEYMKNRIDDLHGWYTGQTHPQTIVNTAHSICFYDSIVVIEKRARSAPVYVETGYVRTRTT